VHDNSEEHSMKFLSNAEEPHRDEEQRHQMNPNSQQEMFEREGYSDDLLSLFYINKPQKKVNNHYFQEWKDKNYYEVHYIRVKHKNLNDLNNVFLE
jgi:hypothetical protein